MRRKEHIVNGAVTTDPLDCGWTPVVPCVEGGGCDQMHSLQSPPCPALKMPSRKAGGQWEEMKGSVECPAVMQAMPDDFHHPGVPIPPTKRENETQGRRREGGGRQSEWEKGHM